MKSKVALVTGGTGGIGGEICKALIKEGYQVIAGYYSGGQHEKAQKWQVEMREQGYDIALAYGNIRNWESCQECIEKINREFGSIDVLVNNAGRLLNKPFLETSTEEFKAVYNVNVFGVAAITKLVIPFMDKKSHVVTVSSMGGVQGSMKFSGLSAYSSSKAAVITMTELWAEEFKETGPSFNVLALGAVQTEMLEEAFPGYQAPITALEMAVYIMNFALTGNKLYNGKLLQVSNSTP